MHHELKRFRRCDDPTAFCRLDADGHGNKEARGDYECCRSAHPQIMCILTDAVQRGGRAWFGVAPPWTTPAGGNSTLLPPLGGLPSMESAGKPMRPVAPQSDIRCPQHSMTFKKHQGDLRFTPVISGSSMMLSDSHSATADRLDFGSFAASPLNNGTCPLSSPSAAWHANLACQ